MKNGKTLKFLTLGDIVGPKSLEYVCSRLWKFRNGNGIDAVIANGENAAEGNGIDITSAEALLSSGVDVITSGNHIWQKKGIFDYLDTCDRIVRPANYPACDPGKGYTYTDVCGYRVLVINVSGVVFMDPLADPFRTVDDILTSEKGKYDFSVLDVHAEATSEKNALAYYFDGRINFIFGTHTHVATADERVLKGGTAYITDVGMCGPSDSVLGVKKEIIIEKFRTKMPKRHFISENEPEACGAIAEIDTSDGRCISISRIKL